MIHYHHVLVLNFVIITSVNLSATGIREVVCKCVHADCHNFCFNCHLFSVMCSFRFNAVYVKGLLCIVRVLCDIFKLRRFCYVCGTGPSILVDCINLMMIYSIRLLFNSIRPLLIDVYE